MLIKLIELRLIMFIMNNYRFINYSFPWISFDKV